VAPLSELFEYAQETRRQAAELRAEMTRLTERAAKTRRAHVVRRQSCEDALARSQELRETVPSWPAWSSPTAELRLTLVPVD
jgi:hypothetical protein